MGRDATDKQQTITDATDAFVSCTTADDTIAMRTLASMDEAVCNLRIAMIPERRFRTIP